MLDLSLKERPSKRGATTHGYILCRAHSTLFVGISSSGQKGKNAPTIPQKKSAESEFATVEGVLMYLMRLWIAKVNRPEGRLLIKSIYLGYFSAENETNLKKNLVLYIDNVISLVGENLSKNLDTHEEWLHASDCAFSILVHGIANKLTGKGRQLVTDILLQKMSENITHEWKALVILRSISWFIQQGGHSLDNWDNFAKNICPFLELQNNHVILWAAFSLRAVAEVLPHWTVPILSYFGKELTKRLELGTSLIGIGYAMVAIVGAKSLNKDIVITLPVFLRDLIFELGTKLICIPSPAICNVGWTLLAAFCTHGPVVVYPYLSQLLGYWQQHLAIQAEPTTDQEINRLLVAKFGALSSFLSFLIHCPVLLTQEILDRFKSPYHSLLRLSVTLTKKETDSTPFFNNKNGLLHHVIARVMAMADVMPSIDHLPGRKELSLLMSYSIGNPPRTFELQKMVNRSDDTLDMDTVSSEGVMVMTKEDHVEIGDVHVDGLWSGTTLDVVMDVNTWTPNPRRILIEYSVKVCPKILSTLKPEKVLDVYKFFLRCYESARGDDKIHVETNIIVATLGYLRYLVEIRRIKEQKQIVEDFNVALLQIILNIVEPLYGAKDKLKRRAVAEITGLLASLQNEAGMRFVIKRVTTPMLGGTTDEKTLAGCALSLGCIHRYGAARSRSFIKDSIKTLTTIFRFEGISIAHQWSLHSIWIIFKESAGLSVTSAPESEAILTTIYSLLQHETISYDTLVSVLANIGALTNTYISALGPEILKNQSMWSKCLLIKYYIETTPSWVTQVESIRMRQAQYLLFPKGEGISEFGTLVESNFGSLSLPIRQCAVMMMHIFLEYKSDPFPKIENKLFVVLDRETDKHLEMEIRSLILEIIKASASKHPSVWISVCRDIFIGPKKSETNTRTVITESVENPIDEFGSAMIKTDESTATTSDVWNPSISTQIFAVECVSHVIKCVKSDPRNFDLIKAQSDSSEDWLVLSHQMISDIGFRAVAAPQLELRHKALQLLNDFQMAFSESMDPDYEGHYLLEMSEGQIGLAYRAAIKQTTFPPLQLAAASLMGKSIKWIFTHFDKTRASRNAQKYISVIVQILESVSKSRDSPPNLIKPEKEDSDSSQKKENTTSDESIQGEYDYYSEHDLLCIQVVLLQSFAEIFIEIPQENLGISQSTVQMLKKSWMDFLRDYAILSTQEETVKYIHKAIYYNHMILRDNNIREKIFENWTVVLAARAKLSDFTDSDWYIVLGLAMYCLSSTTKPIQKKQSLIALSWILSSRDHMIQYLSPDGIKEIFQMLQSLKNNSDKSLKISVLELLLKIVPILGKEFLVKYPQIDELIAQIVKSETNISENSSTSPEESRIIVEIIHVIVPLISASVLQISDVLLWLIKYLDKTNITPTEIQRTVNTIVNIVQEKDENLRHATIWTILNRLDEIYSTPKADNFETSQQPLILAAMRILSILSYDINDTKLHHALINRICESISSNAPVSVGILTLTLFRNFIESSLNPSDSKVNERRKDTALAYVYYITPTIILQLRQMANLPSGSLTGHMLQFPVEAIKFLVVLHNISLSLNNSGILGILVPTLIGLLNNTEATPSALHVTALQVILGFVQTNKEECAAVIEKLPFTEKQVLQIAVQANYLREQEKIQKEKESQTQGKLTLDVSNFST